MLNYTSLTVSGRLFVSVGGWDAVTVGGGSGGLLAPARAVVARVVHTEVQRVAHIVVINVGSNRSVAGVSWFVAVSVEVCGRWVATVAARINQVDGGVEVSDVVMVIFAAWARV